ncbi:MAG TPA: PSD1 and planctomycete cytochrome C domain-containing protein [Isosphaeraceae bacterium]|jgi:mono/diheme cytochrome c family protein|nr:PSD1 and planctomycete cytochrome C domain-containing protein [Isosphaeraceae bacterium]
MRRSPSIGTGLVVVLVAAAATPAAAQSQAIDFDRDIRPIFEARCYDCHGPKKQKADLRLDDRAAALRGGADGPVIVPGKGADSDLIARVTSDDPEERMPPKGPRLSAEEVDRLRTWIDRGADWPAQESVQARKGRDHWAFKAPSRPALPEVKDPGWVRSPIDRFILARLEKEGLHPSPEADKATLIRRLSLDLIGLPPTVEEVDAFLDDNRPDAYDRLVDRLLASPHYGERWGRVWLDAARYADSDGFEKDKPRFVWFYRDWVVKALNRDLPYDRFVIEQVAGDLLPDATQDQRVATGFLRNSMINEEGGVDPEQFRMEAMFDRMDAIGKGILGLTIQCAQCHNHKFDPITQRDYYRVFAFLNDSHEANVVVYTPDEQLRREAIFREVREVEAEPKHTHPDWPERLAAWEESARRGQPDWTVVRPKVDEISDGGQKYVPQADGSFLAQGYAPTKHRVKMTIKVDAKDVRAFRLELLNDPNLPRGGPGRSIEGTAALTEFEVEAAPADHPEKAEKVKFVRASADVNPPETPLKPFYHDKSDKKRVTGPAAFAIDGKDETAWGIDVGPGRRNRPRKAVFVAEKPVGFDGGTILTFFLKQNHGGWNSDDNQNHNLGRFRLAFTTAEGAEADPLPLAVREALSVPRERRNPAQEAAVFGYWRTTVADWKDANDRIEALWREHPEGTTQLVLEARDNPRETHVLQRGDFLKPAQAVEPGVPSFLHPLPNDAPANRLGFARWLVDRKSPTTARSLVNRVWQGYFGLGLVGTSEDLGTQSEPPSHPGLLDWLAVEFMERGWGLKDLHRLIVTSASYRQQGRVTPELLARDPFNRLLARGPRFRVDAEVVRDVALAASGLLNPKVGGPSVGPPAPAFLFQPPTSYGPKVWPEAKGPERFRRALYTFRYRSVPYPVLQNFDAPNGDFACVRRARSNTPLQALTTLNEPLFLDCARALARTTLESGGSCDSDRLTYAFRRCLARRPTEKESTALLAMLDRQARRYGSEGHDPKPLIADGDESLPKLPEGVTPARLAAWTAVARVLLNLDETITKE